MLKLNFVFDTIEELIEHDIYLSKELGRFYIKYTDDIIKYIRNKLGKRIEPDLEEYNGDVYIEVINRIGDWELIY